jgi:hypothetical protein
VTPAQAEELDEDPHDSQPRELAMISAVGQSRWGGPEPGSPHGGLELTRTAMSPPRPALAGRCAGSCCPRPSSSGLVPWVIHIVGP